MTEENTQIDIERIMKLIPHRYPMLMVDRVIEIEKDSHAIALKNVSMNEQFFQGHYPGHPVMPGVLIIEAMAQTSAILAAESVGSESQTIVYFTSIENAKFRKPVVPGDQLKLHVELIKKKRSLWKLQAHAEVDGVKVTEATLTAMMMEDK